MNSISKRRREMLGNILLVVLVIGFTLAYAVDLGNRTEERLASRSNARKAR